MMRKGLKYIMTMALCLAMIFPSVAMASELDANGVEIATEEISEDEFAEEAEETLIDDVETEDVEIEDVEIETEEIETEEDLVEIETEAIESEETVEEETVVDPEVEAEEVTEEEEPEVEAKVAGWVMNADGTMSYYVSGQPLVDCVKRLADPIDGLKYYYYFDKEGKMFTGGRKFVGEDTYFFQANGHAYTGFIKGKAHYYYFAENGKALKNQLAVLDDGDGEGLYYFDADGYAYMSRFANIDGNRYYFGEDAKAYCHGFTKINGSLFYFKKSGACYVNCFKNLKAKDGNIYTYHFNAKGKAADSGVCKIKDRTGSKNYYYFKSNGRMVKDKIVGVRSNGKKLYYYFDADGKAVKSQWKEINGKKFYFSSKCYAIAGRRAKIDDKFYYFNSKGQTVGGWVKVNGTWCYFDKESHEQTFRSNYLHEQWKKAQTISSSTDYLIMIDCHDNWLMMFTGEKGDWAPFRFWRCSTGKGSSPTIKGYFTSGYTGYSFGHGYTCYYYTVISGDYLIHSVKYYQGTFNVMDGRLGKNISGGCVRLPIEQAKWIYDNLPYGSKIYTYSY